jgi:hypothetical protein
MKSIDRVINVTSRTVLHIGGHRVTIEPAARIQHPERYVSPFVAGAREFRPADWQAAEAELQSRVNMPFEPPARPIRKSDCVQRSPQPGSTFHGLGGTEVEIARVAGKYEGIWCVVDRQGRPARVRRLGLRWTALPPDVAQPECGNVILHESGRTVIKEVLRHVDGCSWSVTNFNDERHHVLHADGEYWFSIGAE